MIYLFSILFTVLFAFYTKHQLIQLRSRIGEAYDQANDRWHRYGMLMRVVLFAFAITSIYWPPTLPDVFLASAVNIALWDILINVIALNKPPFYPGVKDNNIGFEWDSIGNIKWIIYSCLLCIALVTKLLSL